MAQTVPANAVECRRSFLKKTFLAAAMMLCGQPAWGKATVTQLRLYNTHTDERLTVRLRAPTGRHDRKALTALNWFLRCHYTNKVHTMDPRVLDYLSLFAQTVGCDREIHIISGYRSPEYNEFLRRESGGVARHSLHLEGRALDLRIPAIPLPTLHQATLSLQYGGVGYYPATDFLHLDSGPFRRW